MSNRFAGYTVMSESSIVGGKPVVSVAGTVWMDRWSVENHLNYCRARHDELFGDVNARYFVAEIWEVDGAKDVS